MFYIVKYFASVSVFMYLCGFLDLKREIGFDLDFINKILLFSQRNIW